MVLKIPTNTNEKESLKNLEENFKKLEDFFELYRLTINGDKTESDTFSNCRKTTK